MADTDIQWTEKVWNCLRGCSRVSPGCGGAAHVGGCYAEKMAARFSGPGMPYEGLVTIGKQGARWTGVVRLVPKKLDEPLRWKKPRRIFVNSMSDLFHESLSNETIAAIFGVMGAAPQHTFQVLTKRARRMREWFATEGVRERVEFYREVALAGRIGQLNAEERRAPVAGFDGYSVTTLGRVIYDAGSDVCLLCGKEMADGVARKLWCSTECKSKGDYESRMGRWTAPKPTGRAMSPEVGESGHLRVSMCGPDGKAVHRGVHRLVLEAFDRAPLPEEQGCHINGDPADCRLLNLRWGSQSSNWEDRKRHGRQRSYSKLSDTQVAEIRARAAEGDGVCLLGREYGVTDTQIRNIVDGKHWRVPERMPWPLPGVWMGVSVEDQKRADERIPDLLTTPAAVRWISLEPQLEDVDLWAYLKTPQRDRSLAEMRAPSMPGLGWIVQGGESGHGARGFNPTWAKLTQEQCRKAGVAYFFKQFGSNALDFSGTKFKDSHGGDPSEWPAEFNVRQYPTPEVAP
jgi:protein gp37